MQLDADDETSGIPAAGISAVPDSPTDETAARPSEDTAVEHESATDAPLESADAPKQTDDEEEEEA